MGTTPAGKALRLRRLLGPTGRALIVPMDHGVSSGPVAGLEDIRRATAFARDGGARAIVVHKGLAPAVAPELNGMGLLVHLSASTGLSVEKDRKVLVGSVEECVALGADGASVHVNLGGRHDAEMLRDLGAVSAECARYGIPLLVMAYPRGENVKDPYAVDAVRHAARVAAELGADLVKCPYTGDPASFREVVAACPVPVLLAGGPRMDSEAEILEMVRGAMEAGAAGASIGRNIFQHPDPAGMARAIAEVIDGVAARAVVR